MLYKFKSRATADLIMLEPQGRQIVTLMGKEPGPQGIVTVAQIPQAIAALEAAVAEEEARAAGQGSRSDDTVAEPDEDAQPVAEEVVRLRQRVAPMLNMLRRSAADNADVVWGV